MINIDGSWGEGGGQILRTCLSLATITGQPVRIECLRANRKKPGLAAQHLTSVRAAATLCQAQVRSLAVVTELPAHIPQRMANRAKNLLQQVNLPAFTYQITAC